MDDEKYPEHCPWCMWYASGILCHACDDADQFEEADEEFGTPPWGTKRRVIEIKEIA